MERQEVSLSVVLSEAARRAAQSKDLFSGARCVEAKRGPSTALRSAQDDGLGMTQVVEVRL